MKYKRQNRVLKSGKVRYPFMSSLSNRKAILTSDALLLDTINGLNLVIDDLGSFAGMVNENFEATKIRFDSIGNSHEML